LQAKFYSLAILKGMQVKHELNKETPKKQENRVPTLKRYRTKSLIKQEPKNNHRLSESHCLRLVFRVRQRI